MSWVQKLYETYNNCEAAILYSTDKNKRPLLPICHITAQANIEIVIDGDGNFLKANLVTDADDATTIIPCTEGSASRSGSKPECHPLCDNLQYVAGDFEKYGGAVTSGFSEEWTITKDKIEKVGLKWKDVFKKLNHNKFIEKKNKQKYLLKANLETDRENINKIIGDDFSKIMLSFQLSEPYMDYIKILTDWCASEYKHSKVQAILNYVNKKSLIKDLIEHKILFVGDKGQLLTKRQTKKGKKEPTDIFDLTKSKQDKAFVRWIVESGDLEPKTWKDGTLWERWSQFYLSTREKKPLCYVKGENEILATQHPKYIRAKGDGAKLISSNDKSGFTYRGRFTDEAGKQVCGVSLEVSQKAHNALIWLVNRQGKVFWEGDRGKKEPGLTVVAWAISGKQIPKPTDDPLSIVGFDDLPSDEPIEVSTAQDVANRFKERMLGYASSVGNTDSIIVMCLDSASKGRLAITYYREDLSGSDFLAIIEGWHKTCEWIHEYRYKDIQEKETEKKKRFFQPFIGAPAPMNIAEAAYGNKVDEKLKKATVARLLSCIIDGKQIPCDIVNSAVRRACNRIALRDSNDKYEREWNKTLSIACSLYKKYHTREDFTMALDENRSTRDYLYGRLLAIADRLEEVSLYKGEKDRPTHAARYMQIFSVRPSSTWTQIYLSLTPYLQMGEATFYKNKISEVTSKFVSLEEYNRDTPLSGEFLLAYHCQRMKLRQFNKKEASTIMQNGE